jgi:hypothetical protein
MEIADCFDLPLFSLKLKMLKYAYVLQNFLCTTKPNVFRGTCFVNLGFGALISKGGSILNKYSYGDCDCFDF